MKLVNRTSRKATIKKLAKNKMLLTPVILVVLLLASTTTFFQVRQRNFNNQVSALQQEAIAQMADKDVYQRVHGDYTGDDVETLRPTTLSVDTNKVIQDYGVGVIRIPSIGMELPVLEGMNQANISIGAGTVKPNQRIGRGNFALLSHYMTDSSLLFGGLKNVSVEDEVELTFYGKTATYEVKETRVIHQSEGQYMLDNPDEPHYLTLLTCDGSRVGTDYRLMVRGTLKEE